ncbi:hypothetical protein DFH27DRAFT_529403 [Peziza echinospora]|nr:hypothetical protein DFH27DRAFT_529403 [Peziza echinospora]
MNPLVQSHTTGMATHHTYSLSYFPTATIIVGPHARRTSPEATTTVPSTQPHRPSSAIVQQPQNAPIPLMSHHADPPDPSVVPAIPILVITTITHHRQHGIDIHPPLQQPLPQPPAVPRPMPAHATLHLRTNYGQTTTLPALRDLVLAGIAGEGAVTSEEMMQRCIKVYRQEAYTRYTWQRVRQTEGSGPTAADEVTTDMDLQRVICGTEEEEYGLAAKSTEQSVGAGGVSSAELEEGEGDGGVAMWAVVTLPVLISLMRCACATPMRLAPSGPRQKSILLVQHIAYRNRHASTAAVATVTHQTTVIIAIPRWGNGHNVIPKDVALVERIAIELGNLGIQLMA